MRPARRRRHHEHLGRDVSRCRTGTSLTGTSRRVCARSSAGGTKASAWLGQTVAHIGRLPDRRAVVAHVALHHLLELDVHLRDRRTGRPARSWSRRCSAASARLHDAVLALLDRVGRADQRAGRLVAVHADHRHRGDRVRAGRGSRRGSSTRRDACRTRRRRSRRPGSRCSATDRRRTRSRTSGSLPSRHRAAGIHPVSSSRCASRSAGRVVFSIRQAETLYSGILLRGSSVRCVSRFAQRRPGQ